jgi:hypothetical protein
MWNSIHLRTQKEWDKEFIEGGIRAGDRKKHQKEINSANPLDPVKPSNDTRDRQIIMERDSEAKKITPQHDEALIFKINQLLTMKHVAEHIRIYQQTVAFQSCSVQSLAALSRARITHLDWSKEAEFGEFRTRNE